MQDPPRHPRGTRTLRPSDLGDATLTQLIANCGDGICVLDENQRFVYVNRAGCEILGRQPDDLVGTSSQLIIPPAERQAVHRAPALFPGSSAGRGTATIVRPDGREREIEYTATALDVGGRQSIAAVFHDVTDVRRTERWASAFAHITSGMASNGGSESIVKELCQGVVEATGMMACAVILLDPGTDRLQVVGIHGLPADYGHRFEAALADGLDVPAVRAFQTGNNVVVRAPLDDPVLGAYPTLWHDPCCETIVCIPMLVGGRPVGVLKGFLQHTLRPDADLLDFLDAIGDQAAVAVENASLVAEATEASRRQEALVQAGLTIAVELSLPSVLSKIVESACDVADATYGALGVLDTDGGLDDFITHGVTEEQRAAIGRLPVGRGLLGALIKEARPVRLRRLQDDPRSEGFPPNHPPMSSFLGVPVTVRGRVYGNLYLAEKRGAPEFSEADERAVVTLAAHAGVAIENARLFAEAEERLALEERTRLARELHDSVSQALFAMTLETGAAQQVLGRAGANPQLLGHRLARLRELTEGALAEMRALIFALRPEAIQEEGLVAAIDKHAKGVAAREDLNIALEAPEDRLPLPPEIDEQLYRLTQEALSNVAKHSEATQVWIRIDFAETEPQQLVLEVEDNGVGFDPLISRPGHLGLLSMTQRAEALSGRLDVDSSPGSRTVIRAVVPVPEATGSGDHSE